MKVYFNVMVLQRPKTLVFSKSIKVRMLKFGYVIDYSITDLEIKLYGY